MRLKQLTVRGALALALLAAASTGCQFGSHSSPAVLVNYGTVEFSPVASLAIVIRTQGMTGAQYQVQAVQPSAVLTAAPNVAGSSPAPAITTIEVLVMGNQLVTPLIRKVTLSQVANGQVPVTFQDIPPGLVDVNLVAKDANGNIVARASKSGVAITANQIASVELHCEPCVGPGCDSRPLFSPSPSPSPTPSPVPTDIATALPMVTSFEMDAKDNFYLVGLSAIDATAHNRVVMMDGNGHIDPNYMAENTGQRLGEVSIYGNSLYAEGNGSLFAIDLTTHATTVVASNLPTNMLDFNALTTDPEGNVYYNAGATPYQGTLYASSLSSFVPRLLYSFNDCPSCAYGSTIQKHAPETLDFDQVHKQPVWGSETGIWTLDAHGKPHQIVKLQASPTTDSGVSGLVMPNPQHDDSNIIFTRYNDPNVYYYDQAATPDPRTHGNYRIVATSTNGCPTRLVWTYGNLYMMLTPHGFSYSINNFHIYDSQYRIIRFDFNYQSGEFYARQVILDTFLNKAQTFQIQ